MFSLRCACAFQLLVLSCCGEMVDVGSRKQVLWDDALIEKREGVRFEMHPAVRTGEVLLTADKPWEAWMSGIYGTVLRDGGKFRMWYAARATISQEYIAYAESEDGLHWRKPE